MKKLMLTSAAVLFLAASSLAQDGGKCCKKDGKKCETTACTKGADCKEKCCVVKDGKMECKKDSKDCCMKDGGKKSGK